MSVRSNQHRYGVMAQALHWVSAAVIVVLIVGGLAMTRVGDGDNTTLYRSHVALGLLVAVLTLVRVAWRVVEPSPIPPPMEPWRRLLFVANHTALYVVLAALAVSGIGVLLTNDITPVPSEVVASDVDDVAAADAHLVAALIYTGLMLMHVVGVISHQRRDRSTLARMGISFGPVGATRPAPRATPTSPIETSLDARR